MTTERRVRYITSTLVAGVLMFTAACSTGSDAADPSVPVSAPSTTSVSTPASNTAVPTTTSVDTGSTTTFSTPSSSTTPVSPTTTASTGVVTPTSSTSIDPAEAAARKAVEKIWLAYEKATSDLWEKPQGTWKKVYKKYAVEPLRTGAYEHLVEFVKAGKGNWGEPVHHLYWQQPIDGKSLAILMDCIDSSHTGSMNAKTGKKLTRGVEHDNTRILVSKQKTGWKIAKVTGLPNLACPGADMTANQEKSSLEAARSTAEASS